MFKCFLLVGVCYINYESFQTNVYKIGSCYMTKKEKLVLCKNSVNSTSEVLVHLFMLRRWAHNSTYTDVANPHNHIYDVHLAQVLQS
jgi:hypothetical protein